MSSSHHRETATLIDQLERSYRGGAWHGPALLEALDGVGAELAVRRPIPNAHTIAELVGHLITWIEVARRRIEGEEIEDVTDAEDFPTDATLSEDAWRDVLERLERAHQALLTTLSGLDDADLDRSVAGSDPTVRGLVLGTLQHSAYHGGQIRLLAKPDGLVALAMEDVA